MQRKAFWMIFISLSLIADFTLPLLWGLLATLPLALLSWWIAYSQRVVRMSRASPAIPPPEFLVLYGF